MIKLIALQTHNILMKIELTCSTYYFRMNYIEIKHYTEIMQQHVKKNLERRKQIYSVLINSIHSGNTY